MSTGRKNRGGKAQGMYEGMCMAQHMDMSTGKERKRRRIRHEEMGRKGIPRRTICAQVLRKDRAWLLRSGGWGKGARPSKPMKEA